MLELYTVKQFKVRHEHVFAHAQTSLISAGPNAQDFRSLTLGLALFTAAVLTTFFKTESCLLEMTTTQEREAVLTCSGDSDHKRESCIPKCKNIVCVIMLLQCKVCCSYKNIIMV